MRDFRELRVWTKAYDLARGIYAVTAGFPKTEQFGLTNQMRRAAVSVVSNLAEGCGRDSDGDMKRFAQIAMGSACELECQLMLARDLGFLTGKDATPVQALLLEVKRMLGALVVSIR